MSDASLLFQRRRPRSEPTVEAGRRPLQNDTQLSSAVSAPDTNTGDAMADLRTSMPFPTPPRRAIDTASPPGSAPVAPVAPVIPAASVAPASRRQESTLTVGQNISLTGHISACDVLIVDGHVEASISCRLIEIAPGGVFNGKAEVDTAEVNGRIEGELVVKQLLRVHAGGQVDGCIRYGTLEVSPGGRLAGDVATRGADTAATTLVPVPVHGDAPHPQQWPSAAERRAPVD